jgi:hypothetical protein
MFCDNISRSRAIMRRSEMAEKWKMIKVYTNSSATTDYYSPGEWQVDWKINDVIKMLDPNAKINPRESNYPILIALLLEHGYEPFAADGLIYYFRKKIIS